jgi:flagellar hook-length control protein FliK
MTNLPITTSAPQTAPASATATNSSNDAQNSQPFGDVLARQIKEPAKDAKSEDNPSAEILARLADAADGKKADIVATDATSTLPADMLAALLPQALNTATGAKTEGAERTVADQRGGTALKADVTSAIQTDAAPRTVAGTAADPKLREPAFAAAFAESANRGGMEFNSAARETISAAAAPQPNAAALAALQNTAASLAAPAVQTAQLAINTPVTQDKWGDEFSQKITWLASSNQDQTAELHLNPPQLGPLDVVLKVSGDQATALFTSPHAAVRDAIEQAMPKLRDMLADSGIMLGNATVSDQAPRDQGGSDTPRSSAAGGNDIGDGPQASQNTVRVSQISRHNGIVDTFA